MFSFPTPNFLSVSNFSRRNTQRSGILMSVVKELIKYLLILFASLFLFAGMQKKGPMRELRKSAYFSSSYQIIVHECFYMCKLLIQIIYLRQRNKCILKVHFSTFCNNIFSFNSLRLLFFPTKLELKLCCALDKFWR